MKIQAADRLSAHRLEAVRIKTDPLESELLEQLEDFEPYLRTAKLLGQRDGVSFYKVKHSLVCALDHRAVGYLDLQPIVINIEGTKIPVLEIFGTYLTPELRGRGIAYGMYQWAISRNNILSDWNLTPDSFRIWTQLAKSYNVQVLTSVDRLRNKFVLGGEKDNPATRLLIKRS